MHNPTYLEVRERLLRVVLLRFAEALHDDGVRPLAVELYLLLRLLRLDEEQSVVE
jgi:hypothetical protein